MPDQRLNVRGSGVDPASMEPPRRQRSGFHINVQRQGCVVNLSLTAGDEYGAVELYEHVVRSLEQGKLSLDIR